VAEKKNSHVGPPSGCVSDPPKRIWFEGGVTLPTSSMDESQLTQGSPKEEQAGSRMRVSGTRSLPSLAAVHLNWHTLLASGHPAGVTLWRGTTTTPALERRHQASLYHTRVILLVLIVVDGKFLVKPRSS